MSISIRTKVLLVAAIAIGGYVAFSPGDPTTAEPRSSNTAKSGLHPAGTVQMHRETAFRALSTLAHRVSDNTSPVALFASHSWYTPPPPPPPPPAPPPLSAEQLAVLNTPKAPPLPYSYMGTYSPDGSKPVYFLTQGDRVFDVRVGDTLDDTYTIDSFANGQLVLTYKPLNIKQQLSAGGSQ
ncbi:MAG: prolin-rich transrane protein [Gammaproteobacteria bacterium]|nr:prolin-rich transrane protein [Gammaproteobacteria bacterium]